MLGLAEEVDHAFRLTASARAALATRPPVLAPDLR
jgi:hypothetical protein